MGYPSDDTFEAARQNRTPPSQVARAREACAFNLVEHLYRQRDWSARTFGPREEVDRTQGVIDHLRKEIEEVAANPHDLSEWIDVVILALDGAWRQGFSPLAIVEALAAKQAKNEAREWPDWRESDGKTAIEHVRAAERARREGGEG